MTIDVEESRDESFRVFARMLVIGERGEASSLAPVVVIDDILIDEVHANASAIPTYLPSMRAQRAFAARSSTWMKFEFCPRPAG